MSRFTPTLGCMIPYPSTTTFFFGSITGLFKICAIAPTNSKPEFKIKSVSASKVIIYLNFGKVIVSSFCISSFIVFSRKGFNSCPNRYSLN